MVRNGFSLAFVHVLGAEQGDSATSLPEHITTLESVVNAMEETAEMACSK